MIALTRLNFESVMLNSDLIETIETTPDTVIRLTNGQKLIVRERAEEVLHKVRQFRMSVVRVRANRPRYQSPRDARIRSGHISLPRAI